MSISFTFRTPVYIFNKIRHNNIVVDRDFGGMRDE